MDDLAFRAATVCRMLGSTTRYRILKLLAKKQMTPGQLRAELGKSASVISVQLAKLQNAGLVRYKREPDGLMYWAKSDTTAELFAYVEHFARTLG